MKPGEVGYVDEFVDPDDSDILKEQKLETSDIDLFIEYIKKSMEKKKWNV